ncbi:MAG: magnesium transporter [Kiritimatiellia bacterium]|jgi:magnesium transporter
MTEDTNIQELQDSPELHPADIADALQQLPPEEAVAQLRALPTETASEVLTELDEGVVADITAQLTTQEITDLLEELPHDEAADIAADLSPDQRYEVLSQLEPPESAKVTQLMHYPEDSAGGIMKDEFIAIAEDQTIGQALDLVRKRDEEEFEEVSYLYVIDINHKLVGILSVRDLVFRMPHKKIRDVMSKEVRLVRVDTDQEEVARLFSQYHYMALPVVEQDGRLVGVVEAHQVIDILREEATEDMQLMVGMSGEESAFTPWRRSFGMRMPWLLINLLTAFLAGGVIAFFEDTLARWTALAIFLPIIAGQGGNSGMQTLTVTIRSMALGELKGELARKVVIKELLIGLLNGLAIGIIVGIVGLVWQNSVVMGIIVMLAMFLNTLAAAIAGTLIPLALRAAKVDPALSSSIFLTTVTDVAGFFFFLGLATLLIPLF